MMMMIIIILWRRRGHIQQSSTVQYCSIDPPNVPNAHEQNQHGGKTTSIASNEGDLLEGRLSIDSDLRFARCHTRRPTRIIYLKLVPFSITSCPTEIFTMVSLVTRARWSVFDSLTFMLLMPNPREKMTFGWHLAQDLARAGQAQRFGQSRSMLGGVAAGIGAFLR